MSKCTCVLFKTSKRFDSNALAFRCKRLCVFFQMQRRFLSLNFTQFQPAHGLLIQFVIEQRQTLGFLGQFVHAECTAAQGFFYLFLFFLQCGNLFSSCSNSFRSLKVMRRLSFRRTRCVFSSLGLAASFSCSAFANFQSR